MFFSIKMMYDKKLNDSFSVLIDYACINAIN